MLQRQLRATACTGASGEPHLMEPLMTPSADHQCRQQCRAERLPLHADHVVERLGQ